MANTYIGVRVELASRIVKGDLALIVEQYNSLGKPQIFDLHTEGKITVEHTNDLLIARGEDDSRKSKTKTKTKYGGMVNFALMIPIGDKELLRVVQIINVLGNGRLIRERIKTFTDGQSALNQLPEMQDLVGALNSLNGLIPGLINGGCYYAPEAKFQ